MVATGQLRLRLKWSSDTINDPCFIPCTPPPEELVTIKNLQPSMAETCVIKDSLSKEWPSYICTQPTIKHSPVQQITRLSFTHPTTHCLPWPWTLVRGMFGIWLYSSPEIKTYILNLQEHSQGRSTQILKLFLYLLHQVFPLETQRFVIVLSYTIVRGHTSAEF